MAVLGCAAMFWARPTLHAMKYTVPFFVVLIGSFVAPAIGAKSEPGLKKQEGQRATATLLATARIMDKAVPDGALFLVLVSRKADTTGQFSLKETRDFKVAGESLPGENQG